MPLARRASELCSRCGDDTDVWVFEKGEGTITKECYSYETCGCEWTEVKQD